MKCKICNHESWCHTGMNLEHCETYKWIRIVDEKPIGTEPGYEGMKGVSFQLEYGPECDCSGFAAASVSIGENHTMTEYL